MSQDGAPAPDAGSASAEEPPDYGPAGYLPGRAAKRARKIVLRGPMSAAWAVSAVVVGILVALVGVLYLTTRLGPPGPPYQPVTQLTATDAGAATLVETEHSGRLLIVRAGGGVRAFAAPVEAVRWCGESRRLESTSGQVWDLDGRLVGGAPADSLVPFDVRIHDGVVYVDPTSPRPAAAPQPSGEVPTCEATG